MCLGVVGTTRGVRNAIVYKASSINFFKNLVKVKKKSNRNCRDSQGVLPPISATGKKNHERRIYPC